MTDKCAHSNTAFFAPIQADRLSGVSVTNSNYSLEYFGWEKGGTERLVQRPASGTFPKLLKRQKSKEDKPKSITATTGNTIKR